jgi:arylformamidase
VTDAPSTVYRSFAQSELNREYDASATVASVDPYFAQFALDSERTRARLEHVAGVRYAAGERRFLDLFPAKATGAPLLFFIHGGYWRRLDKSFFSFVAGPVVDAGGAAAIVNYPLAPGAALDEIVTAVRDALTYVRAHLGDLHADARRIVVAGHSAGGQLAGMLASDGGLAGIVTVSGLFDLEPVRLSHVNEWMQLDAATAARNSPALHLPANALPLVAAVGEAESGEFRRQTALYAEAWRARKFPCEHIEVPGKNHFSVVSELGVAEKPLAQKLLALLESARL